MKRLITLWLPWLLCFSAAWAARADEIATAPTPDPEARLSISDATIIEGHSRTRELLFPVTLSKSLPFDVSASFVTKPITASANSDYVPQSAGQIVLKAGQTRTSILVRVVSDTVEEKDESFLVQLGAPKRVAIADSDGIGNIKDDDYSGQISVSDASLSEGNSGQKLARVQVSFSKTPLHDISVGFETKDEGAKVSTGDYITSKGTLLFRPGRLILSVSVPVVGDTLVEGNERCYVRISAPGYVIAKNLGFITILNDDAPPPLPVSGKIAFSKWEASGTRDIYVMNADGSSQTRLTFNQNDPGSPSDDNRDPSFSRDGQKIVFVSDRDFYNNDAGGSEIYVMNSDGTGQTRLTFNAPLSRVNCHTPRFSPDGQKIVFARYYAKGLDDGVNSFETTEIYGMNADGSNPTQLTAGGDRRTDINPSFSPDGQKIVFQSNQDGFFYPEIYVVNADGTNKTRLTNRLELEIANYSPSYSPDGQKILFSSVEPNEFNQPRSGICLMNADGTGKVRLRSAEDREPCFSPDGSKIAFVSGRNANNDIYTMNADGSGEVRLTTDARSTRPSWAIDSVAPPTNAPGAVPAASPSPSSGAS